ncbi:RHS repeat-associated core domain-containing protein [uncultured Cyclobacterium sp.]|uniref:RHS repeat-associated core domain-containing protein n=1 Tax=uncultured Cyclobacterium sp. TaxID=453820 RepID=UPI0030EEAD46
MAVYKNDTLIEQSIYGSSRLGLMTATSKPGYRTLGGKKYELSNHLGNVLAVVSDNIQLDQDSTWASVINTTDYYPFGLAMDGRTVQDSTYRYLYQGKELIDDLSLNIYDHGARFLDPTIGRWMSPDPLAYNAPEWSPYNSMWNNPVLNIDADGRWANPVVNSQGEFLGYDELGAGGEAIVYDGEFKEGMSQDAIFNNGGQFANDFFTGSNFSMGDVMDFQSKANQSFKDKRNTEAVLATGDLIGDISTGLSFMTGGAGSARVAARNGLMARGMGNQALTASPTLFKATEQTSRSAVKRIAQSMSQIGWQGEAIHAYKLKDGTFAILNGHHRVQAATRAGIDVQYKVLNFTEAQSLYGWKSEAEIIMSIIR